MVQTVLLVEDDPQIARALTRMLRKGLSVEVVHVESNRDAIAFLATTTPSLVIMDLARPEGRGEDLVEYIREDTRLGPLPIVVVSGQLFGGFEQRLFEYRIDGALSKPVTIETFLRVVTRCLSGSNAETNADEALIRVGAESKSLDYKHAVDLENKKQRACLAKDVIAFFNAGGGSIVIGVAEGEPGCFTPQGITEAEAKSFEVTRLNDALRRYIGTEVSVGARRVTYDGKVFVFIAIPSVTTTLAFARDEHREASLYRGRIYARNDAAQSVEVRDAVTLNEILERVILERTRRAQPRGSAPRAE